MKIVNLRWYLYSPGLEVKRADMEPYSSTFLSPFFSPVVCLPFISLFVPRYPPKIQLRSVGKRYKLPTGSDRARSTNGFWCILSWKSRCLWWRRVVYMQYIIRIGPYCYQQVAVWFETTIVPVWYTVSHGPISKPGNIVCERVAPSCDTDTFVLEMKYDYIHLYSPNR